MKQNAKKKKAIVAVCGVILALLVIILAFFHFTRYNNELVRVFYGQWKIATFQGQDDRPLRTFLERQCFDEISGEHQGQALRDFTCYVYKQDSRWMLFNPTKNRCAVLSTEDTAALQTMLAPENLDKRAIG